MTDASKADIRIIDFTASGNVIHCLPHVKVKSYDEELFIFGDDRRFVVSDSTLDTLNEQYTVATDF